MAVAGIGGFAYQKSAHQNIRKADGADFQGTLAQAAEKAQTFSGALAKKTMMQMLRDKIEEMYEKLQNGDVEQSFQIGAQSFTLKEWDRFLEKFDNIEDAIREMIEKELEKMENEEQAYGDCSGIL